jgi:F-type H+-transporting ATPase subunit delta
VATKLSRRKLADHVATQLLAGNRQVVQELAAYSIESGRQREVRLIVRSIEAALADKGVVVAQVASAVELSEPARAAITEFLVAMRPGSAVQLHETVEPALIGGVKIDIPGATYDGSVRHKLTVLRDMKQ